MRIAFDAKRAFLNKTGLGNYSRNVLAAFCASNSDSQYFLCTPEVTDLLKLDSEQIETLTPNSTLSKMFPSLWRSKTVLSQLQELSVDLYHGMSNELPFGISKTGIRSVVTIHDLIFLRYPSYYPKLDSLIYSYKVKRACSEADRIIAVSEHTKNDIVELLGVSPCKIDVVYQTCHEQFKSAVSEEGKNRAREKYGLPESFILYVGTIEKRKNLLSLIDALKNVPDTPIVVVGKATDYLTVVQSRITQLGLEKRVVFIHNAGFADLPAIYQLAEMLVYPSQYEGFGIPILEALYSGIPVITTQGGCFEEAGGPNSLYVPFGDWQKLSETIQSLLADQGLRQKMISGGIKHAFKFNNDAVAAGLTSTYRKALES